MSLITPEEIAQLDILDSSVTANAIQEDIQITSEPTEKLEVAEEKVEDDSEAKTKAVVYREEIVEEDETSTKADESEVKGTEPLQINDDSLVIDPMTGEEVTGRELKNRMLMQSDYTKKTMELAQMKNDLEGRLQSLEAKTREDKPEEEDPYDPADPFQVAQKKTNDELKATQKALSETQVQLREMNENIQLRDHQNAMDSFEQIKSDVLKTHEDVLTAVDIEPICRQFMVEAETNPRLTYEDTANVYADRIRKAYSPDDQ